MRLPRSFLVWERVQDTALNLLKLLILSLPVNWLSADEWPTFTFYVKVGMGAAGDGQ
jgi:hypothetical protein